MKDAVLKTWFAKSIFEVGNFLPTEEFNKVASAVQVELQKGSNRTGMLNVDSTHSTNNFVFNKEFDYLRKNVFEAVKSYAQALGYTKDQRDRLKFIHMWANESSKGDFNFPHNHGGSLFSGAFYIKAPTDSKITFYDNFNDMTVEPDEPNHLSHSYTRYNCVENSLLIFKSDLLHGNEKQEDGTKIVISFNVAIDPPVGKYYNE